MTALAVACGFVAGFAVATAYVGWRFERMTGRASS